MTETPPEPAPLLTVDCWLIDTRGLAAAEVSRWDAADPAQRERAAVLAAQALRHLTGGVVEPCVRVARPCAAPCTPATWQSYPVAGGRGSGFSPRLDSGTWINVRCGVCSRGDCGHNLASIRLPGASEVVSVWVDGAEVDSSLYALRGDRLVRIDGTPWPRCQNLDATREEGDTFEVRYRASVPGRVGEEAAGRLAVEYLAALTGGNCALPSTATSVNRAGVSFVLSPGAFPGGLTGVREVDAWVALINPHQLSAPSQVLSPDLIR